ncbi:copper chaperone PCu(A)C [Phaeospirillum tilakii]|uniref:Copper chaperone PCu(A)C n=1 Tax=Phaeospirillum tilakii TaxID=741673 RepID=A0ABW5CE13_9PROT
MFHRRLPLPALALFALLLAPAAQAGEIEAVAPTLRLPPLDGGNGALFLTLVNHGPADRLIAAAIPGTRVTELHTHRRDGDVMRMRRVEAIELPADGRAELRPGGDHIMAIGLSPLPSPGATVTVTLTFAQAGTLTVEAVAASPAPAHHGHDGQ